MKNPNGSQSHPVNPCAFPFVEGTPCHPAPGRFSAQEMDAMGHVWDLSQKINQAERQLDRLDGPLSAKSLQYEVESQLARLKEERGVWQKRRRQATHAKHAG